MKKSMTRYPPHQVFFFIRDSVSCWRRHRGPRLLGWYQQVRTFILLLRNPDDDLCSEYCDNTDCGEGTIFWSEMTAGWRKGNPWWPEANNRILITCSPLIWETQFLTLKANLYIIFLDFCLREELKKCFVHSSVCLMKVCLELSNLIFRFQVSLRSLWAYGA